ncbi:MAG: hypothetical protein ACRDTH_28340 [Pseudonocardiaceae bacterium]
MSSIETLQSLALRTRTGALPGYRSGIFDAFVVSPGHDAWIVGDEPCVALDWSAAAGYAKPAE